MDHLLYREKYPKVEVRRVHSSGLKPQDSGP